MRSQQPYRGRFAPSPSGYLHFGSLVTALASFLDAKNNQGTWLVRIEDIDPPREKDGASKHILNTLESFGLQWDEKVLYQSQQTAYYNDILAQFIDNNSGYYCQCTRAQIKAIGGIYQNHCRDLQQPKENSAIRIKNNIGVHSFNDIVQGPITCNEALANEDFIVLRKDQLFAYQLAVVADDIAQKISHVIRGCDLLEPTARQLSFFQILNQQAPLYGHIPLAVTAQGYKLSKQNKALPVDASNPIPTLIAALKFLGQQPPETLVTANVTEIIQWAIEHWQLSFIPKNREIQIPDSPI